MLEGVGQDVGHGLLMIPWHAHSSSFFQNYSSYQQINAYMSQLEMYDSQMDLTIFIFKRIIGWEHSKN